MKPIHSFRTFVAFALAAMAPTGMIRGQDELNADGVPVVHLSELVLDQYPVQNVDIDELFETARQLVGRNYYIKERPDALISGMRVLGTRIVLYDTKEEVQRARELLARLDVPSEPPVPSKVVEYRPRFVSLNTVKQALEGFVSLNVVEERGMIVMSDDEFSVDQALSVLARIDVPAKQVLITAR
jgi:type II secretory pathway component GspD/PulD (secretin)